MMSWIWVAMAAIAVLCALGTGKADALTGALTAGAGSAVTLCLSLCGMICLWSGVMEVMRRSGLAEKLSAALRPILGWLFPKADRPTMQALSANVSANLLGLGNAATPMGLLAAKGLQTLEGGGTRASHGFALLVVINTASLQIIPVTVASLRSANGAVAPFDILPHVWLTSLVSMAIAIASARLCAGGGHKR